MYRCHVVSSGGEDDVDGIALGALQPVAFDFSVGLGVSDDRFDGARPSEFALDGWRGDAAGVGQVNLRCCQTVTAIAALDVGELDPGAGQAFNRGDLALGGVWPS